MLMLVISYALEYYMINVRKKPFALHFLVTFNNCMYGLANAVFSIFYLLYWQTYAEELVFLFYMSKMYEFLDLVLVVLTHNEQVVGAHFRVHHITTASVVWASFYAQHDKALTAVHMLPILTNTIHHMFMYLYFGGVTRFRKLMPFTGTIQLVVGVLVVLLSMWEKQQTGLQDLYVLCMYAIYLTCQIRDVKNMKQE